MSDRKVSVLVLWSLIFIAFVPLLGGLNFLPFPKNPEFVRAAVGASGQEYREDEGYLKRFGEFPYFQELEPSSVILLYPQERYTAENLRRGVLPLWDPYTGCGVPTVDNGFFRPFNPLRLLFYAAPTSWSYCLSLFLCLALGAWGAFLWFRKEVGDAAPAALGAGIFALNPWALEHLVLPDAPAYFLLPWCILALQSARWGDLPSLARAALVFALSGHISHPEGFVLMSALAFPYAICCPDGEASVGWGRRAASAAAVTVAATAALAVLWYPAIRLYLVGFSYKEYGLVNKYPFDWRALWGLPSDLLMMPALVVLLACAARPALKDARGRFWSGVLAASALIILPMPLLGHGIAEWVQRAAYFTAYYFKAPLWAACAFLAARGYAVLRDGNLGRLSRGVALCAGAAWLCGIVALAVSMPLPLDLVASHPLLGLAFLAFALVALALLRAIPRGGPAEAAVVFAVLLPLAWPLSSNQLPWNRVDIRPSPVVEWVRTHRPNDRAVCVPSFPGSAVPPNLGQLFQVRSGEQFGVMFLNLYNQLFHKPGTTLTLVAFDRIQPVAFRQLGVSLFLMRTGTDTGGIRPLYRDLWFSVYAVPGASGRLFFASAIAPRDPYTRIDHQIVALCGETDTGAVVEPMGQPTPDRIPTVPPGMGSASFQSDGIHRLDLRAQSPSGGLLVLKDSWYPGWEAEVDGMRVPIYRVNGCFRGVAVPGGSHRVEFLYRPRGIYIAAAVSLLSLLLLAAFALIRAPRRRVGKEAPPP